jgi:NAD(P)-dependent dehydrogenase (short-subunit alcohol dehydrogenase family)
MAILFITGCSTGIGFAAAETLSKKGHIVYAGMRNPKNSPELQELADKEKLPLHIIKLDVNEPALVKQTIADVIKKEGQIDVLINNAGIAVNGAVEEVSEDLFRSVMETNYFGTLRCIQAVLPSMRQRRSGTIINITSVAGRLFSQSHSAYCGSKAAVEALSECLAQEVLPYNIRVAVVEPGVIETPIFRKENEIPEQTNYPNSKRLKAFFAASLENHIKPEIVALVLADIIDGRSNSFRNPAGPDAAPLLQWRASVPDETWINAHNIDDETWISNQEKYLNLNVRPYF